jgi:hypothetical protein
MSCVQLVIVSFESDDQAKSLNSDHCDRLITKIVRNSSSLFRNPSNGKSPAISPQWASGDHGDHQAVTPRKSETSDDHVIPRVAYA